MTQACSQLGILVEDSPLQLLQRRPGLQAELVHEPPPRIVVDVECVGLAARLVEREHLLPVEALTQRMLSDKRLELTCQLRTAPQRKLGLEPPLPRLQL